MKKHTLFYSFLLCSLLACDELPQPVADKFVVEAFVTAGARVTDVKVKESGPLFSDSIPDIPIAGAVVSLSANGETVLLDYNPATGKYEDAAGGFPITTDEQYALAVSYNGVTASASTVVPEPPRGIALSDSVLRVPELTLNFGLREQIGDLFANETLTLSWEGLPGRSYFVVIERKTETIEPILPEGIPAESIELLSSFRFISEPSEATEFTIIAIALETYGLHVARVYTVNPEYEDLFNSAAQDSRDLNEPPTNLSNALGIFSAFAVDSLEFTVLRE